MDLKDKLDLLWKYLLLLLLSFVVVSHLCYRYCGGYHKESHFKGCWRHSGHHDHHEEIEDVQVKMEVDGEDTLLSVIINGRKLPADEARDFMEEKEEKGLRKILGEK